MITPRRAEGKKQFCLSGQRRGGSVRQWEVLDHERERCEGPWGSAGHKDGGNAGGRRLVSGYVMEDLAGLHVVAPWIFLFIYLF